MIVYIYLMSETRITFMKILTQRSDRERFGKTQQIPEGIQISDGGKLERILPVFHLVILEKNII